MNTKSNFGILNTTKRFLLKKFPCAIGLLPSLRNKNYKIKQDNEKISIIDFKNRRQIWLNRTNAVYLHDMINYFDYYFDAVEPFQQPSISGGHLIVDYSSPRIHRVNGFLEFPISCPSLVEPYQTCQQYLEFAELSEGENVLDLGAYSGLTSIVFSMSVKQSGKVIALEPDPKNLLACSENFKLHSRITGLNNILLLPLAISSKGGMLLFSSERLYKNQ